MHLFPEIDTPALLVDVEVLERNLDRMAASLRGTGCGIRPHFKAHRMAEVCRRQLERGAHGVTCAKLAEAEVLAGAGFDDFLVANQVVAPLKWRRLAALAERCSVTVGVDDADVARATAAAAREQGSTVGVLVEVDSGMHRCGAAPGEPSLELARLCADLPGLRFRGLMAYEGHAMMLSRPEKEAACREAIGKLTETAALCREAGLPVEIVSAGGTGSWDVTPRLEGVTELQCGTYALMDLLFRERAGAEFDFACTVLATVISRPTSDRAVTDAGKKALHPDFGLSRVTDCPGAELRALNSEHGILHLSDEAAALSPGDQVRFIPSYVEGTVNLYDHAYAVRDGMVLERWEVTGQGRSQ